MSKNSKKIIGVFAVLLLVLVAYVIVDFYPKTKPSVSTPLDYTLSVYPSNGTVLQANNCTTNINMTYTGGSPELVILTASGGPNGTECVFSKEKGTPSANNTFTSNLTINVPADATSDIYTITITSTSANGNSTSKSYDLTVLNAEVQVSGTVTANSYNDIFPTEIKFVNTADNSTYSTPVKTTSGSPSSGGLIQSGTYSISLPNQHIYRVICTWATFEVVSPPSSGMGMSTFEGPSLTINCGIGVNSIYADYSD